MRIDLHTHSSRSDGTAAPRDLVRAAAAAGLDVVALTDHDTTDGWQEAADAAVEAGVALVRGIEVSTRHHGRSVHLLAYLPDPAYPPLQRMLAGIVHGRDQRVPRMVERLRSLGHDVTEEAVLAKAGPASAVGRPHVADVLVDLGVAGSRDEAFADLLRPGGGGYVSRWAPALDEAVEVVAGSGGVGVLAHPWGREGDQSLAADELARLRDLGLAGLEVDHLDHSTDQRRRLRGIADDLGLVVTGSSDHHGAGKPAHHLGIETTDPEQYERLLAAAGSAAAASGRTVPEVVTPG